MKLLLAIIFLSASIFSAELKYQASNSADILALNSSTELLFTYSSEEKVYSFIELETFNFLISEEIDDEFLSAEFLKDNSGNSILLAKSESNFHYYDFDKNRFIDLKYLFNISNPTGFIIDKVLDYSYHLESGTIAFYITSENSNNKAIVYSSINDFGDFGKFKSHLINSELSNFTLFQNESIFNKLSSENCELDNVNICALKLDDENFILSHKLYKTQITQNDSLIYPVYPSYQEEDKQRFSPSYWCKRITYSSELIGFNCNAKMSSVPRDHFHKISSNLKYMVYLDRAKENIEFAELVSYYTEDDEEIVDPELKIDLLYSELLMPFDKVFSIDVNDAGFFAISYEYNGERIISIYGPKLHNSISEIKNNIEFSILANQIEIYDKENQLMSYSLYDYLGNELKFSQKESTNFNINISDISSGTYFIRINKSNINHTFKFILN